jgi:hypothetical protein
MEARTAIRGSGISRSFAAVCAVVVTMGLGVTAGVVAKNLSAPAAAGTHIVLGQGGAQQYSGHRGGVQVVDGPAASTAKAVGPDDRTSTSLPAYHQYHDRAAGSFQAQAAPPAWLGYDTSGIIPAEALAPSAQLAPNSFLGPDAQERNAQLAAQARTTKALGYI